MAQALFGALKQANLLAIEYPPHLHLIPRFPCRVVCPSALSLAAICRSEDPPAPHPGQLGEPDRHRRLCAWAWPLPPPAWRLGIGPAGEAVGAGRAEPSTPPRAL